MQILNLVTHNLPLVLLFKTFCKDFSIAFSVSKIVPLRQKQEMLSK
jgi:hypothetical protein